MSQISDSKNPWRDILLSEPASFESKDGQAVIFHVEQGGRSSGRRTVVHEYPKRNDPYAEDMGRQARRIQFSAYLIYRPSNPLYEYTSQRKRLYEALEADDVGRLIHPVFCPGPAGMMVVCLGYSMTESRERGGYTQFELQFVEAGTATTAAGISVNNAGAVTKQAKAVEDVHTAPAGPVDTAVGHH